jgi:galactokinase
LGSRLTGAGWGGCTVSLVPAERAPTFIEEMVADYYSAKPELQPLIASLGIHNIVFESQPSEGACIIIL